MYMQTEFDTYAALQSLMSSIACDKIACDTFGPEKSQVLLPAQGNGTCTAFTSSERQHHAELLCMQRISP